MKSLITFFLSGFCTLVWAQSKGPGPAVFKVRAPHSSCSVFVEDTCLWLEKDNRIRVKVRGDAGPVKVVFFPGKIVSREGDLYTVNFDKPGSTVVSVYEIRDKGRKLIHTESLKIHEPDLYFCGIKVGSFQHGIHVKGETLRIYSIPFGTDLGLTGYDMNYNNGIKTRVYHVKDNKFTEEMIDVMFKDKDPAVKKKMVNKGIYFSNIAASMPDGSIKYLSPFALSVVRDTTKTRELVYNFVIRKMVLKKDD